jgi:hypothetical protein
MRSVKLEGSSVVAAQVTRRQCNGVQWSSSDQQQADIKFLGDYWQLYINCSQTQYTL